MARIRTHGRQPVPTHIRYQVLERYGSICTHCGRKLYAAGNYTIEHVIPLSKGGEDSEGNMIPLCYGCNQQKRDDIVEPKTYYTHVTKEQAKHLQALYEKYKKTVDPLAYRNLLYADRFTLNTHGILMKKDGTACTVPSKAYICKISPDEAYRLIDGIKKRLPKGDIGMLIQCKDEIENPYYTLSKNGKAILLFSAYIANTKMGDGSRKNIVHLEYFTMDGIKMRPYTVPSLYMMLSDIIREIQKTLKRDAERSIMTMFIKSMAGDELARHVHDCFLEQNGQSAQPFTIDAHPYKDEPYVTGSINGIAVTLFQGSSRDIADTMRQNNVKSQRELQEVKGKNASDAIDRRLEGTETIPAYHRKKKYAKKPEPLEPIQAVIQAASKK